MIDVCAANNVQLTFNHQRRFGKPFRRAKELLDGGAIGRLERIEAFADNLYDGYCGAIGPGRLEAAGKHGIPQVVTPGGLDCIVLEFDSPETMPEQVKGRKVFWYDYAPASSPPTAARFASCRLVRPSAG